MKAAATPCQRLCSAEFSGASFVSKLRVIADDLTGAADVSAPLATSTEPAMVYLHPRPSGSVRVASYDTNTRNAGRGEAEQALRSVASRMRAEHGADTLYYLKIDSRGRSHFARDVSLLLREMPWIDRALVVPAYPSQGRSFRNGRVVAEGVSGDSFAESFFREGLRSALIGPAPSRADGCNNALGHISDHPARILLPDAETDDDLRRLWAMFWPVRQSTLFVGSAGLTEALRNERARPIRPRVFSMRRAAFVIGTQAVATRRQIDRLSAQGHVARLSLSPSDWMDSGAADRVRVWLARCVGTAVLLDIAPAPGATLSSAAVEGLAQALRQEFRTLGPLFMSGGDTARAVLTAMGIESFAVEGAVDSGLCLCRSEARNDPFFTKSGGFGDEETLLRLCDLITGQEA